MRFGIRMLDPHACFALPRLSLAIGIGANTAIFTVVNAVLLRPPRIRSRTNWSASCNVTRNPVRVRHVARLTDQARSLDYARRDRRGSGAAYNLTGVDEPERFLRCRGDGGLVETLRVEPMVGRRFTR